VLFNFGEKGADKRYKNDYFLKGFCFEIIPKYLKNYIKIVKNNKELKEELNAFRKKLQ